MNELAETLRAARPEARGAPPTVAALRQELAHRRRRRQQLVVGTMTIMAVIGVAGRLVLPGGGSIDTIDATGDDLVGSSTELAQPTAPGADGGEWSVLLPIEEWRPIRLVSTPIPTDELATGGRLWLGDPGLGALGPLVQAAFNPRFDSFESYADGPLEKEDRTAVDGTEVRIGYDHGPEALDAIVLVEGGSVALQAIGLAEEEVVELAASLRVEDGVPVVAEGDVPAGLAVLDPPTAEPGYRTEITLRRPDGPLLTVEVLPASAWDAILATRVVGAGSVEEVATTEGRGFTFRTSFGTYGAAVLTEDRFYRYIDRAIVDTDDPTVPTPGVDSTTTADDPPAGEVDPEIDRADLSALVDDLGQWTELDLVEALHLEPRSEVVADWMAGADLPPDHGLDWLADGPPLDPEAEVGALHLWLVCSLVDHWERTGDGADLDAVAAASTWPTGRVLEASPQSNPGGDATTSPGVFSFEDLVEEAAGSTVTDRSASDLRHSCTEPLGSA